MTIAAAFAAQSSSGRGQIGVLADTRLSVDSQTRFDLFVKSRTLGPRTAIVGAGPSHPIMSAAEVVRPFIRRENLDREEQGRPRLSGWEEVWFFSRFLHSLYHDYAALKPIPAEVLAVCFFSDNSPGLYRMSFEPDKTDIRLFKPQPGKLSAQVIGVKSERAILGEALALSFREGRIDPALSCLHDMVVHNGLTQIGGGVELGFCWSDAAEFGWPVFEVGDAVYLRGLPVERCFPFVPPEPQRIEYDPGLYTRLAQQEPEPPVVEATATLTIASTAHFGVMDLLHSPKEPTWLLSDEPPPHGVSVWLVPVEGEEE